MSQININLLKITKGAGIIFIGVIISNFIGIVIQILFGRILGPENYGLFNLGLSVITILGTLIPLGLSQGLTQYIPHNLKQKNYANVKEALKIGFKLPLAISILSTLIVFLLSDQIAIILFHNVGLGIIIKIFSFSLPFWSLHNVQGGIIQAFKKPSYYVYIENILMPLILLGTFLIVTFAGFSLFGAIIGFVFSSFFAFFSYLYLIYFKIFNCKINDSVNNEEKKVIRNQLISISFPLFLSGFTFLFMQYADKILLGIYMTPADVGIYTAALTIASLMLFVYSAFSFNFRPLIAESFAMKKIGEIKNIYSTITKWIFIITAPLLTYIIFYSKDILYLIFGNQFISGSLALSILCVGIAMNGLTGLSGETLVSIRKTKLNLYSEIIGAVSNIVLNIILIPIFGILGAAIGTSISIFLRNASSLLFVNRILKFNPYNFNYLKIIICSILPLIVIYFVLNSYFKNPWDFLLMLPIYLLTYLFLLELTQTLDKLDKDLITNILHQIKILINR